MTGSLRAIAVVALLAPAVVLAQPNAKEKQQASDLVKKAIAKSQAGEHDEAVELYLQAYTIIPQPLLLSNIGSEYQQMKKPVEALKYFCKYIEADPTGNNVSYAVAQVRTLHVDMGNVPPIDDEDLCKPIVNPEPQPAQTPAMAPVAQPEPQPQPQPTPIDEGPKTKTPVLRYVGVVVAVMGAGAFGGGVYFGLEAKKISDEITNHDMNDPWPANIKDREADGKAAEKKQIGLMIGGGAAVVAGITMIILGAPKAENERSASIVPLATGDTLGVAAAGRF
jgi:tetratricopeptide (TPR) repeat protein